MDDTSPANAEQAALWNGRAGSAWVQTQAVLDAMFQPLEARLTDAVRAVGARRVLDVGCGTGRTTLAVARQLGATGECLGIDISAPMIEAARARAAREALPSVRFVCADVQGHAFEPAAFDMVISRLGVMFFDDPVRAFANLRGAAADGAALRCIAWRGGADNPFMTVAERAAAPLLPGLPPRRPNAPGQFAFADRARVADILGASGWGEVDIQPFDVECAFSATALVDYFTRLGPVGLVLQEANAATREKVVEALRTAFAPYVQGDEVRFVAACWMIGARASVRERGHV
ncbi:class I SAM-dependent methyltransferase [Acidovorax cavernicola]|uniref:Class I SAM-dependent methyltransferase n=1 Tax=Acidovorax cavernicola TaxID=1675792 RepID=A0A9X8GUY2_9BURK|nr:class I SAM-dependent methyltransferase [Acidovorax cavernicola]RIX79563.1 class I SAM-dependent methyltransferase [Acidovorax cavernicola]